ncbi:MAG: glycosyltransferase [Planctomycetes bacterium]|nr:glycosyltransferase [Planctomycetota bacterium]
MLTCTVGKPLETSSTETTSLAASYHDRPSLSLVTRHSDRVSELGRPLRAVFLLSSMPVGGAETLLVNMMRRFRPDRVVPAIACMKDLGTLGGSIQSEFPTTSHWLRHKYDFFIVDRLADHFVRERVDAVVTVGAGDKMFWGRIAARLAGVPVVCSALHSTGWPDGVGRLNRMLTRWTDRFIAVAKSHGEFLRDWERFPENKVVVIPNGVDTFKFRPDEAAKLDVRRELELAPSTPLVGIVAALRPEKNHSLFLEMAKGVLKDHPSAKFLIIGDGPERSTIEHRIRELDLRGSVILLGSRLDTDRLVAALDVFSLTSLNEASPVSILEAMACGVPVVSTRVGSVAESVLDAWNGFTVGSGDSHGLSSAVSSILADRELASLLGSNGRQHVVESYSLDSMVAGYEELLATVFVSKRPWLFPEGSVVPSTP